MYRDLLRLDLSISISVIKDSINVALPFHSVKMVFWSELCNCAFCTLPCTSLPVDAVIVNNIDSDSCVLIDNDILILKLIYTGYNCKKIMHGTLWNITS